MPPVLLFSRIAWGRVSRGPYWLTIAAYALLELAAFFVPLEIFYRLQSDPTSWWVQGWIYALMILQLPVVIALARLTVRRLHDSGRSGAWLWLLAVPVVGWLWLLVLLLAPSGPENRWDRMN